MCAQMDQKPSSDHGRSSGDLEKVSGHLEVSALSVNVEGPETFSKSLETFSSIPKSFSRLPETFYRCPETSTVHRHSSGDLEKDFVYLHRWSRNILQISRREIWRRLLEVWKRFLEIWKRFLEICRRFLEIWRRLQDLPCARMILKPSNKQCRNLGKVLIIPLEVRRRSQDLLVGAARTKG